MPETEQRPAATARVTAILLLLAGVVSGLAAVVGVASPDVPGTMAAVTAAAWVAVLPGLFALLVTLINPIAGLAAAAAAGTAALVRLLPDLSVLFQPESVARPELFYPVSGRAFPLESEVGAILLLAADLLALVAGVLAARALVGCLESEQYEARHDADAVADGASDAAIGHRPTRNMPMISLGFVAVVLLGIGNSGQRYSGGYIAARMSVPGTDFGSLFAPFVLAIVAIIAVLVAATMPRAVSLALLGGAAVALVVPSLTALVVVAADAPAEISGSVWLAVVGAVLLAATGWFSRVRAAGAGIAAADTDVAGSTVVGGTASTATPAVPGAAGTTDAVRTREAAGTSEATGDTGGDPHDEPAPSGPLRLLAGAGGVIAGIVVVIGSLVPVLLTNGAAGAADASGYINGATFAPSLLAAGILLVVVGTVAGLGGRSAPFGRAGRAALTVVWVAPLWPLAEALSDLGRFQGGTQEAERLAAALGDSSLVERWHPGPGLWLAVAGGLVAVVAGVIAAGCLSRERDEELLAVDEDAAERSHRHRWQLAGLLGMAAVLGLSFRVYSSGAGTITPHELAGLFSFGTGSLWAAWLVLLAVLTGLAVAASTRYPEVAAGATAAAAAVVAVRQLIPPAESAADGFGTGPGVIAGWLLAGLLLTGAVAMWRLALALRPAD